LLALRVELVNMKITPGKSGKPPEMAHGGSGDAFIVLHYPPQSIAEQVFFETAPAGMNTPDLPPGAKDKTAGANDTGVAPPPIRARIAGESRVVFEVPSGFKAPYNLAGVLDACEALSLRVPANAAARASTINVVEGLGSLAVKDFAKLSSAQKVQLGNLALRTMQLAVREGAASSALASRVSQNAAVAGPVVVANPGKVVTRPAKPALPSARQTAIEMPWRLILAPHAGERFRHAAQPVTSPVTQRTELWHSRLIVAPDARGRTIEPPRPDPRRTLRAVWALTGENSDQAKPMSGEFPTANELPTTSQLTTPFLATLDDFDRYQITHLSSNFSVSNYQPEPLDANLM